MKHLGTTLIENPIDIYLCTTEKQFHRLLVKLKLPRERWPKFLEEGSGAEVCHLEIPTSNNRISIVRIKKRPKKDIIRTYSYLAHEAVHIWQEIKEFFNEDEPSREFEAYSVESIFYELMQAYNKAKQ